MACGFTFCSNLPWVGDHRISALATQIYSQVARQDRSVTAARHSACESERATTAQIRPAIASGVRATTGRTSARAASRPPRARVVGRERGIGWDGRGQRRAERAARADVPEADRAGGLGAGERAPVGRERDRREPRVRPQRGQRGAGAARPETDRAVVSARRDGLAVGTELDAGDRAVVPISTGPSRNRRVVEPDGRADGGGDGVAVASERDCAQPGRASRRWTAGGATSSARRRSRPADVHLAGGVAVRDQVARGRDRGDALVRDVLASLLKREVEHAHARGSPVTSVRPSSANSIACPNTPRSTGSVPGRSRRLSNVPSLHGQRTGAPVGDLPRRSRRAPLRGVPERRRGRGARRRPAARRPR